MRQDEGFLRAIIEDPEDDTVRLFHPDWLGDPRAPPRAEFIRVQIELARMAEDDDRRPELETREGQLLAEHAQSLLGPLYNNPDDDRILRRFFRRGFLDRMTIESRLLLREADGYLRDLPVRSL